MGCSLKGLLFAGVFCAAAGFAQPVAQADFVVDVVDLSGAVSDGTFGDPGQVTTVNIDGASNLEVVNFQWVLAFEAFSPSWGSEARIDITSPNDTTFTFSGADVGWDDSPGVYFAEGSTNAFNGSPLAGDWTFTFYESFDDPIEPDGEYLAALFVVTSIPTPAVLPALMLGGLVCGRRRRQA